MLTGLPQLLYVFFNILVDLLHGEQFLSVFLDVTLFDSIPTFENNKVLPFFVNNSGFAKLHMRSISSLANIYSSFIQFGSSIIRVFFFLLEFVFIFNIIINLNVSRTLDIKSMWILEIVNFFSLLLIYNCWLETQLLFHSILL